MLDVITTTQVTNNTYKSINRERKREREGESVGEVGVGGRG